MASFVVPVARRLVEPLVPRFLLEPRLRRRFFREREWQNLHWGVFDSFAHALAFAEKSGAVTRFGADHEKVLRTHATLKPHDYPVLFWLARILSTHDSTHLVDLGGSIGASYFAYRDLLSLPDEFIWTVCELSEVAAQGRAIAAERSAPNLRFTDDIGAISGAAILFSAGCLQYMDASLPDILSGLERLPRHIVINRVALTDQAGYVTLQNTGYSISPCRVDNAAQFSARLAALGYEQRDAWACLDNHTEVPFHPECTLPHFRGACFRLVPGAPPSVGH